MGHDRGTQMLRQAQHDKIMEKDDAVRRPSLMEIEEDDGRSSSSGD
jgi:hypothetical protein